MLYWLFGLILALVVAVFANQNPLTVDLNFFGLVMYRMSLSVVILGSALLGALVSFFFSGVRQLKQGHELKKTKKSLDEAGKREVSHLEEIKTLQLSREKALIEAERASTGDTRALREELLARQQEVEELKEALAQVTRPVVNESTPEPEAALEPETMEPKE